MEDFNRRHRRRRKLSKRQIKIKKMKRFKRRLRRLTGLALAIAALFTLVFLMPTYIKNKKQASASLVSDEKANLTQTISQNVVPDKEKTDKRMTRPKTSSSYKDATADSAIRVKNAVVLDLEKNELIAGKASDEKMYPASMTKVMTLLVAVENIKDLNASYTFDRVMLNDLYLQNASVAGFLPDETVPMSDLLYGMIMPSGADAAQALSKVIAGSEEAYVDLMNKKVEQMGLTKTHFKNTTGLHDEDQYTTATEMAMIMKAAMENPLSAEVLSKFQYNTTHTEQHPDGINLTSTMFSEMYGTEVEGVVITAGKTGFTSQAGSCLASYANKGDRHFICVTAGGGSKWHCVFDSFTLYRNYLP